MPAPDTILRLIDRFDHNKESYENPGYNETQLRREFLDPFFAALGWDVENKHGYAEAYKDVVHEDAIKVGSATKAPDYSFRIGGMRKFFVEAKKPSINLKDDTAPAYQLRRYAWSAKLPLSILTDFEEFVVYDCRIKPVHTDKSSTARTLYLPYTDYEKQWEEIFNIFSHEAVLMGSFDKYAETNRLKKGTAEVDDAFLKEIESWRDTLARTIALRNTKLTQRELNFAVQRTIDRIIFLRICEDRGVETYGTLMALQNGERIYKKLCELFYRADEKYNSGLFHFQHEKKRPEIPDELTLTLDIDDKPLIEIIKGLYYPDSPYEFSVLPADILGQVYEQFLGKVIRLTQGHRAVIEDKPEVKKAGGVYYTPTYIVEYIVKNTVGKLLEGKTPNQAAKLRILDPACGSGSFVIGAYQHLLNWHRDWYMKDGVEKWTQGRKATLYQGQGGDWRLTTTERKRILLNNIYGVDIDSQAVEVTKLSLLLKVLEGENEQTLSSQLKLFHERALPDLGDNIKCGNSLIGPDFYDGQQPLLVDQEDRIRINDFNWRKEFLEIMRGGGFDAVIGNPPYVRVQTLEHEDTDYFKLKYNFAWRRIDISILFIEMALRLLSLRGLVGFITSNQFLSTEYGRKARLLLLKEARIISIVNFGDLPVFQGALTYTSIFLIGKGSSTSITYNKVSDISQGIISGDILEIDANTLSAESWSLGTTARMQLISKLKEKFTPLANYAKSWYGIISGLDEVLIFEKDAEISKSLEKRILLPIIRAQDCSRYGTVEASKLIIYPYKLENGETVLIPEKEMMEEYPKCYKYLSTHRRELQQRKDSRGTVGDRSLWYPLVRFGRLATFRKPKIVTPGEVKQNKFAYDSTGAGYSGARVFGITSDWPGVKLMSLLGILNSKLVEFYLHSVAPLKQGGYYSYSTTFLDSIPLAPQAIENEKLMKSVYLCKK